MLAGYALTATKAFNNDTLRQTAAERPRLAGTRSASRAHVMQALAEKITSDVIDLGANASFRDSKRSTFAVGQTLADGFITTSREGM